MDTDDLTKIRIARNQSRFREANEKIDATARDLELEGEVPFICECPDGTCLEIVPLTLAAYDDVRRHPRRFFTAFGHEAASVGSGAGTLVASENGYMLVDKVGIAGDVAAELDPR